MARPHKENYIEDFYRTQFSSSTHLTTENYGVEFSRYNFFALLGSVEILLEMLSAGGACRSPCFMIVKYVTKR
ncbi:hypothetical protein [Methanofollis sp. W23]|uniref:hypothetical protein n=1 Tax=Methanofollis sp. W23 TaxID=2817849 RepID=UPI001AE7AE16|nr:hypothetical protein [Methanofollis sp. W23]